MSKEEVRAAVLQELYYINEVVTAAQDFKNFFKEKYGDSEIECFQIGSLFAAIDTLEEYEVDAEIGGSDK